MATDRLDIKALTAPIPVVDAEKDVWFDLRAELDEARKRVAPDSQGADKPGRAVPKEPDWEKIVRLTTSALATDSKDLRIAIRLAEALVKLDGFAGLRDGLGLLRSLVDECWDVLKPPLKADGSPTARLKAFDWLDDPDGGGFFPMTVRLIPIVSDATEGYGWLHFNPSLNEEGKASKEATDRAQRANRAATASSSDHLLAICADMEQCLAQLGQLVTSLIARTSEEEAPALVRLRSAIEDCLALARRVLESKGPGPSPDIDKRKEPPPDDGGGSGKPVVSSRHELSRSRAEVYQRLAEAADLLQEMEPNSPSPYLIRLAIQLGGMPFPQVIKALISDTKAIEEVNRRLGITEPPSSK